MGYWLSSGNTEMESIRSFEDLECWKACRQLRIFVAKAVLPLLPKNEQFEMVPQLRKASRSTTANIAEGYGRFHFRDNYKFCSNARGSLFEVLDHLIAANDEGYLPDELLIEGRRMFENAKRLLNGYMNYLQRAGTCSSIGEDELMYGINSADEFPGLEASDRLLTHNS